MTTIDIYARVSLDSDLKLRSTEGQVADCRDRIEDAGHEVGEVFIDNSKSAWNPKVRRPEWERLMAKIEAGRCEGLIVFDMARFSRKPIDGERLITAAGKGMLVLDSENGYDLSTANGRKTFRDHLNAAAYESDRLSTRVKRGKRRKAEAGLSNHARRPFGFEPDGVTLRPGEAALLREAGLAILRGASLRSVARGWEARGATSSAGNVISSVQLRLLLLRPRNAGLLGDSERRVLGRLAGVQETIFTEDEFARIASLFDSRRRGRPWGGGDYLCSGVLVCGRCGARMHVGGRAASDGDTGTRRYFCPSGAGRQGCGRVSILQPGADAAVEALVLARLCDEEVSRRAAAQASEHAAERRALQAEIAEVEGVAGELAERLGRGDITMARYDRAAAPLDARLAALTAKLDALPVEPEQAVSAGLSRAEVLAQWEASGMVERRRMLRLALAGQLITVKPGARGGPRNRFDPSRLVIGPWSEEDAA